MKKEDRVYQHPAFRTAIRKEKTPMGELPTLFVSRTPLNE